MADAKISALTSAGALTGTEEVPIVQSGVTVKTTTQDIADLGGGGGGGGLDARSISPLCMMMQGNSSPSYANTAVVLNDGTQAHVAPTSTTPAFQRATTAASANANGGFGVSSPVYGPLSGTSFEGFHIKMLLVLPDGSYGSGSTGVRLGAGIAQNGGLTTYRASDSGFGAIQAAIFQYSTQRGDTNWQFITSSGPSGTDTTITDTGVAFSPGVWEAQLWMPPGGASCGWSIRQSGGSAGDSGSVTTTLPNFAYFAGVTNVGMVIRTLTSTARAAGIGNIVISSYNEGP